MARARRRLSDERGSAVAAWIVGGVAVLTTAGPADLTVAVRGHEPEHLRAVHEDRTVRLRPLAVVHVALPEVEAPAGTALALTARPLGLPVDELEVRFADGRRALRSFTRPPVTRVPLGSARVVGLPRRAGEELELEVWLEREGAEAAVEGHAPEHVGDERGGPIRLSVPAAAVRGALDRLRR